MDVQGVPSGAVIGHAWMYMKGMEDVESEDSFSERHMPETGMRQAFHTTGM
jgi:hypothetical protein